MPRRFNYTGRKRIRREDITIHLLQDTLGLRFTAALVLADYGLDRVRPLPRVYVEAYRGASAQWRRFDFGPLDACHPPDHCSLDEFGVPEGILFRVKVTGTGGDSAGRLLAGADAIHPSLPGEAPGHVQPLIQHVPADDIGDELWRVDFSGNLPLLKINERVPGGVNEFLRDPVHRATITPAVMRRVLERILIIDNDRGDVEDGNDWRQLWLRFATNLSTDPISDADRSSDDLSAWIDRSVEAFSAKAGLLRALAVGSDGDAP